MLRYQSMMLTEESGIGKLSSREEVARFITLARLIGNWSAVSRTNLQLVQQRLVEAWRWDLAREAGRRETARIAFKMAESEGSRREAVTLEQNRERYATVMKRLVGGKLESTYRGAYNNWQRGTRQFLLDAAERFAGIEAGRDLISTAGAVGTMAATYLYHSTMATYLEANLPSSLLTLPEPPTGPSSLCKPCSTGPKPIRKYPGTAADRAPPRPPPPLRDLPCNAAERCLFHAEVGVGVAGVNGIPQ